MDVEYAGVGGNDGRLGVCKYIMLSGISVAVRLIYITFNRCIQLNRVLFMFCSLAPAARRLARPNGVKTAPSEPCAGLKFEMRTSSRRY